MSKRAAKGTGNAEPAVVRKNPRVSARTSGGSKKKSKFGTVGILVIVAAALIVVIAVITIGIGCNGKPGQGGSIFNNRETEINVEVQTDENGETIAADSTAIQVERQNLLNNDSCQIIITAIDTQNPSGYTIDVELVNKTDSSQMYSIKYATVDGLSVDPNWASEVGGGSTKEGHITFHKSDYAAYNLGFTDIQLVFVVNDAVETSTQITQQAVIIYPYGAGTASVYTRKAKDSDVVLVDNDSMRVTYIGSSNDDVWGYSANVYIENKTGTNLWVSASDAKVNGVSIDPFWGTTVPANASAYNSICWTTSQFSEAGITDEVSSIEMMINANNYDDWEALQITSEAVTINP